MIKKPTPAFQYYLKKWKNLSMDEKMPFENQAKEDKERYDSEMKVLEDIEIAETIKRKIYLQRSYGRVPCIGLDNGFSSCQTIGPVEKVEEYSESELLELKKQGINVKYKSVTIGKCKYPHNVRSAKKWHVTVYGYGGIKCKDYWWCVQENYEGHVGHTTYYNNYQGDTWEKNY
tara:strand:+ start:1158 stop:1679 length:522 start_codon:yes stop_codon:yes gene_type:complete